jgi:parvulin-like peptidyl-prolyl isomerase
MGNMEKIRSLAPWFILTVGGIFILFMVVSDMNFSSIMNDRGYIGEINGSKITIQEFETYYQNYLQQLKQNGQDPDMTNEQMFREQAWERFVQGKIVEAAYKKYGITVSDDEVRNVILGENPPEYLKSQFIDSATGVFKRAEYESAIKNPQNKKNLLMVENAVRQQILGEKLQAMIGAGVVVTDADIRRKYVDQDVKMSADFALVDLNVFPDSTIKPTDDELKDYFGKNSYLYKQDASRKVKFATFKVVPSDKDTNAVMTFLNTVAKQIRSDSLATFKSFVDAQSEVPYSKDTVAINTLPATLLANSSSLKEGAVIGPVGSDGQIGIYKITSIFEGKDPFVNAVHILLKKSGNDKADLEEANKVYSDLKKGANFGETAKRLSQDPGSAVKGGDLGWFGKGAMVAAFDSACFKGPVGEVQAPVKTEYGYHIIKVLNRSSNKFVVEKIIKKLVYSPETSSMKRRDAEDFLALAKKDGIEKAAKDKKVQIQESTFFTEDVSAIPGLGYSKNLVTFSFKEGLNDFSPASLVGDQYVIAQISGINEAGIKKFDTVKTELTTAVIKEKKFTLALNLLNSVKGKIGNDLAKAPSEDRNIRFGTADSFSVGGNIPALGLDYPFSYAASKATLNTVTGPVKGMRGYYLLKVKIRDNFSEQKYLTQRNTIRDQILGERKQAAFQQWMEFMKKEAKVKYNPQN